MTLKHSTARPVVTAGVLLSICAAPAAAQTEAAPPNISGMWDNTRALFTSLELPAGIDGSRALGR